MTRTPKPDVIEENKNHNKQRHAPITTGGGAEPHRTKVQEFKELTLTGSQGQTYKVTVPASYVSGVPKVWEWTEDRYQVAELVAKGVPFTQIPDHPNVSIKNRMTIYHWLEHPEFKEHVDGLIMETGWANRRERLNNLKRLNDVVLNKVLKDIDGMKLTDKSVGALLSAIHAGAKLIAQDKGEFIEESKVTTDMNVTGNMVNVEAKLEDFMRDKPEDVRAKLSKEFDSVGDDIIRSLTGSKD